MSQSDSHIDAPQPETDEPPTVLDRDLYAADVESGTRTVLQSAGEAAELNEPPAAVPGDDPPAHAADLENQKTVISIRPPVPSAGPLPAPGNVSPTELGSLLVGEQLGHFVLDEFVGGGGMGAVFRGTDLQLGRTVAVKVLSRDQGADPETLKRFMNEAQSAARLDHENIARAFFVGEHDGWNFIVFEFIDGINIRDLVERRGPLEMEDAIEYAIQVAEALEHAAQRDVVHRDIKPSNVLVTPDGRAKLVDMGLARLHQMEAGHSDLTASGVTLGTFDYISPEQASDPRQADVRSDLYSLGCTLYFMLVGRPPFPHGTVLQKLLAHSGETPVDPREERPELPPELSKIIMRLLAKRPDQRYKHPREFISEMLILRDRLGLGQAQSAGDLLLQSERLTWRDRLLTIGAPAAVILLVILGLDTYLSQSATNDVHTPGFIVPGDALPPIRQSDPDEQTGGTTEDATAGSNDAGTVDGQTVDESGDGSNATDGEDAASPTATDDGDNLQPAGDGSPDSASDESAASSESGDGQTSPSADEDPATDQPVADPVVRRIVVGDPASLGDLGGSVRFFPTLSEALASDVLRENIEHVNVVEVREDQIRETQPIRVRLPADKQLTIRGISASEVPPRIQFNVSLEDQLGRAFSAIDVAGGRLFFDNLQLSLAVQPAAGETPDLAMFTLAAGKVEHAELSKCVLTIDNPSLDYEGDVAFFRTAANSAEVARPGRLPLHLNDCIVRGRANVISMPESTPIHFAWNNGLLATSERLLLANGTRREADDSTIRLSLLNVTADVEQGLCLLNDRLERPNQPGLELVCNKTIISASDSPLVEHDGRGTYERYKRSLFIRGDWNVYEDVSKFWAVSVRGEPMEGLDWPAWNEKLFMAGGMPSTVEAIRWEKLRSDVDGVPMHLRDVGDYLLDAEAAGSAAIVADETAGFRSDALPKLQMPQPTEASEAAPPETLDAT